MGCVSFQVSTNRTGHHRVIKVRLYDTVLELRDAWVAAHPEDTDGIDIADGLFITRSDWDDRDPRPWQGSIWLALDAATMVAILHEATHAALHLYSIDGYRDHARASTHLHADNEVIPYLIGDLASAIDTRVNLALGDTPMNIGHGRDYEDPSSPAELPRATP